MAFDINGLNVNGDDFSWGSIVIKLGNEVFDAFTKVSYSDKRTRSKGYGGGKHHAPTKRSKGKYEVEPAKITGYKKEFARMRNVLAALSPDGTSYGDVEFPIIIQFEEDDGTVHQVQLRRAVWFEDGSSHDEGPDLLLEEVSFDIMGIIRDGKTLYSSDGGVTPQ